MRWTVHGERSIYRSEWVELSLVEVEVPGGPRFEHHVVRAPQHAAGVVVADPDRGVLLLWRHRFITDTWGWEIPAGRIDEGESAEDAAVREAVEEARPRRVRFPEDVPSSVELGWRPGDVQAATSSSSHGAVTAPVA